MASENTPQETEELDEAETSEPDGKKDKKPKKGKQSKPKDEESLFSAPKSKEEALDLWNDFLSRGAEDGTRYEIVRVQLVNELRHKNAKVRVYGYQPDGTVLKETVLIKDALWRARDQKMMAKPFQQNFCFIAESVNDIDSTEWDKRHRVAFMMLLEQAPIPHEHASMMVHLVSRFITSHDDIPASQQDAYQLGKQIWYERVPESEDDVPNIVVPILHFDTWLGLQQEISKIPLDPTDRMDSIERWLTEVIEIDTPIIEVRGLGKKDSTVKCWVFPPAQKAVTYGLI